MRYSENKPFRALLFCALTVLICAALNFLLVPFSSLDEKFDLYHQETENIGLLVTGSSLEADGIVIPAVEEELSVHAFKFTPQGATPEISYYLLRDVLQKNDVRTYVCGFDILQQFRYPYYIYPRQEELLRSLRKDLAGDRELSRYVRREFAEQRYTMTFFKFAAFPENITEIPAVLKSRKARRQLRMFESGRDGGEATGTATARSAGGGSAAAGGGVADDAALAAGGGSAAAGGGVADDAALAAGGGVADDAALIADKSFQFADAVTRGYTAEINGDDIRYIRKIKELCGERGIELYFLCCPIPQAVYDAIPETTAIMRNTRELFASLGIRFINGFDQSVFPGSMENAKFRDSFGHMRAPHNETYTRTICGEIRKYRTAK